MTEFPDCESHSPHNGPDLLSLHSYGGKEIINKHVRGEMMRSALRKLLKDKRNMEESTLFGVLRTGRSEKVALEHRPEELEERAGD